MTTIQIGGAAQELPFITVGDFKSILSIPEADVSRDSSLNAMLLAASSAVQQFIGRQIIYATWEDRIRIAFSERKQTLRLGVQPVRSIKSIQCDGRILPTPTDGWDIDLNSGVFWPEHGWWQPGRYVITYDAGWSIPGMEDTNGTALSITLPADIRQAVITTARALYSAEERDPLLKSESEQGIGSSSWNIADATSGGLPPDVAAMLGRYVLGGMS